MPRTAFFHRTLGAAVLLLFGWPVVTWAQDARRGAELYMQLPAAASCVSCHGPEPQGNRNSLLKAADNPQALTKALATVGVMSYLRASLDEVAIADLAAFLGSVNEASALDAPLSVRPLTAEFGSLGLGGTAGPQLVRIVNRSAGPINLSGLALRGGAYSLIHDCPLALAASAGCTAQLRLSAGIVGLAGGSLSINSSATRVPVMVALSGEVSTTSGGELAWLPDPGSLLDFSGTPSGQTVTRTLTVINGGIAAVTLGAAPLVAGSFNLTGANPVPFAISGCAAGTVLQPASTCQLTVRYTAGSAADAQAVLQLRSNGKNPPALQLRAASSAPASVPLPMPNSPTAAADSGSGGGAGVTSATGLLWLLGLVFGISALRRHRRQ